MKQKCMIFFLILFLSYGCNDCNCKIDDKGNMDFIVKEYEENGKRVFVLKVKGESYITYYSDSTRIGIISWENKSQNWVNIRDASDMSNLENDALSKCLKLYMFKKMGYTSLVRNNERVEDIHSPPPAESPPDSISIEKIVADGTDNK